MNKKLFAELLNGETSVDVIGTLEVEDIKRLKKNGQSISCRYPDKKDKVQAIITKLNARLEELEPKQPKAVWKQAADPTKLSIEEVQRAIKQAQWYKSKYSPEQQTAWEYRIAHTDDEQLINKGKKFLSEADNIYNKALEDESYWKSIKAGITPSKVNKAEEVLEVLNELEDMKASKKVHSMIDKLKELLK